MASQPKGTAVSFANTPQAENDFGYSVSPLDNLFSVAYLDVMSNDQGGNAKSLWSLDTGTASSDALRRAALTMQDTSRSESASSDTSALGARIWITDDGRVGYDASTIDPSKFAGVAPGGSITDTFIYAIRLGNGALSWATVEVQVYAPAPPPVNHAPVAVADEATVKEDVTLAATGNMLDNDTDIEAGDTHTVTAVNGSADIVGHSIAGTYGTLVLNVDGSYTYTLADGQANVQALADDQTVTDVFTYTNSDNHGAASSSTLTITIAGSNDAPEFEDDPVPLGPPVLGEHSLTVQASLTFADVDLADWHWADIEELGGGLGYVGSLGASIPSGSDSTGVGAGSLLLTYTLTEEDFLAHQDTLLEVQEYLVTLHDNHGATATYTAHLPLTQILNDVIGGGGGGGGGGNANPVILGGDLTREIIENPFVLGGTQPQDLLMASGTVYFTDPDPGQHHFVTAGDPIFWAHNYAPDPDLLLGPPLIGQWSFNVFEPTPDAPGEIHWSYFLLESAARSLAQDESETVVFQHTLSDDHGGQVTQNFRIDLFGSNEAPFLPQSDFTLFEYDQMVPYLLPPDELTRVQTQHYSIDEDPNVTGSGNVHHLDGAIVFADPDRLDRPVVTFQVQDPGQPITPEIQALLDGFHYTIDSHDGNTGTIYWSYDVPDSALDFLTQGTTVHIPGSFVISEIGGSAMSTLDIALNGANDPVVIQGPPTTNVTYNVAAHGTSSGTFVFSDPDWWPEGHTVEFMPRNPGAEGVSQAGGFMFGGTGVESGAGGDEPVFWFYTIFDQSITSGDGQHDVWDVIVRDNFGSTATHMLDFLLV